MKSFVNLIDGSSVHVYEFVNGWTAIVSTYNEKSEITIMENSVYVALNRNESGKIDFSRYTNTAMRKRGDYITDIPDDYCLIKILHDVSLRKVASGTIDAGEMLNKVLKK